MKQFIVVLLICFLLYGCKHENLNEPIEDAALTTKMIGEWYTGIQNGYPERLILYDNGTFVDSFYAIFNDKPNVYQFHFSIKGSYTINGNLLKFNNVVLTGIKGSEGNSLAAASIIIYPQREISFSGNSLTLDYCLICSPAGGNNSGIQGKWESDAIIAYYEKGLNPAFTGFIRNDSYEFVPDKNICRYKYDYSYGASYLKKTSDSTSYSINNNYILMPELYQSYRYELKNGKMYLYDFHTIFEKIKKTDFPSW